MVQIKLYIMYGLLTTLRNDPPCEADLGSHMKLDNICNKTLPTAKNSEPITLKVYIYPPH